MKVPAEAATATELMLRSIKAPFISVIRMGNAIAGPLPLHSSVTFVPKTHTKPSDSGARSESEFAGTKGTTRKGDDVDITLPSVRDVIITA